MKWKKNILQEWSLKENGRRKTEENGRRGKEKAKGTPLHEMYQMWNGVDGN